MPRKHRHCSCRTYTPEKLHAACERIGIAPQYAEALLNQLASDNSAPRHAMPSLRYLSRDWDGHWRWTGPMPPHGARPQVTSGGRRTDVVRWLLENEPGYRHDRPKPNVRLVRTCGERTCMRPDHFDQIAIGSHGTEVYSFGQAAYMAEWRNRHPKPPHYEFSLRGQIDPLRPTCRAGHPVAGWGLKVYKGTRQRCERCRPLYDGWKAAHDRARAACAALQMDLRTGASVSEVVDMLDADPRYLPPREQPQQEVYEPGHPLHVSDEFKARMANSWVSDGGLFARTMEQWASEHPLGEGE